MVAYRILIILATFALAKASPTQNPPLPFRLPTAIVPTNYRLEIISVLDEIPEYPRFTAPGKVWINVTCVEETNSITLHALDINITTQYIYVLQTPDVLVPISNFGTVSEYDFFQINFTQNLIVGQNYEIYIPYIAPISASRLDGIYLDSYVDPATNETKYVSTTLFAANTARRAFPCFDEPQLKATFEIRLGRAGKYHALSNAPLLETTPLPSIPNYLLDIFTPTPKMSTYLVCMIVSDLTYEEAYEPSLSPVRHRVYAPYYFIDRGGGEYSANLSLTVNLAFEDYYNVSYPMTKLDNVALPQFYYNAMENWGLMTFADRVLLHFEGETSAAQKYQLSLTVSHEVSHNFFGNQVTAKWWTWIWLNEGWATFVSHQGLEMTYPELRPWEMFIPQIYQVAMTMDESINTHPIASEPQTSAAIGGVYDDIVYEKAASIIRMTQNFLGEEVLQEGVQRYLEQWKFSNTEQDNLFSILQEVIDQRDPSLLPSGVTFKSVMDSWTLQAGYPLLSVARINTTHAIISQEQFVLNGITSGDEMWTIPINIHILNPDFDTSIFIWMKSDEKNVTFELGPDEFPLVNSVSIGYFRVLYAREMSEQLELGNLPLDGVAKGKLIDDYFTLAFQGEISIQSALDLTKHLDRETELIVWLSIEKHFKKLGAQLQGTISGDLFQDYVFQKVKHAKIACKASKNEDLRNQMLEEKLEELSLHFERTNSKVEKDFEEVVNHFLIPEVGKLSPEIKEFTTNVWKDSESRKNLLQVLENFFESKSKTPRQASVLGKLLKELCPFGNSLEELEILTKISKNSNSETDRNFKIFKNCQNLIKKNIQGREKLQKPVKAWLIKRN